MVLFSSFQHGGSHGSSWTEVLFTLVLCEPVAQTSSQAAGPAVLQLHWGGRCHVPQYIPEGRGGCALLSHLTVAEPSWRVGAALNSISKPRVHD